MRNLFAVAVMLAFGLASNIAVSQSADAPAKSAAEVAKSASDAKKEQKKKNFAAQEKEQQKLSTPGRSLVDNPVNKNAKAADPVIRSGDKKKDFAAQEAEYQKASTPGRSLVNNPIDKNAKAADPAKSLSKMTPEERAQVRKEVVKESKP